MARYAFLIDVERCFGCQACVVACKTGRELPEGETAIRFQEVVYNSGGKLNGAFLAARCFHCADAPCVAVCPTGAVHNSDGLVAVDVEKCSGCAYCVKACPFGRAAIADERISKCTGCLDLIKDGQKPWCVQTCPTHSLEFGEHSAIVAEAHKRVAALKARYPNAQVYGETQLGGLGTVMVLPDKPSVFRLPEQPRKPAVVDVWQKGVQPATVGLTGLSVLATGLAFIVARREHAKEKHAMEVEARAAAEPAAVEPPAAGSLPAPVAVATAQAEAPEASATPAPAPEAAEMPEAAAVAHVQPAQPAAGEVEQPTGEEGS